MEYSLIVFVLYSVMGALAYRLAWSKSWDELVSYDTTRHLVIGAIIGVVYHTLYLDKGFPDSVMSFVAGWMGVDFLEAIVERLGRLFGKVV